jgi:hypothetical protein
MTTLSTSIARTMKRLPLILSICLSTASCSNKGLPLYPVHGRVLLDGKPMVGAMIILHPVGDVGLNGLKPRALADADGWFKVYTYAIGDGAPAGQYAVTVQPKKPKQPNTTAKSKGAKKQVRANEKASNPDAAPVSKVAKSDKKPKSPVHKKQKARAREASCPARYRDPATSGLSIGVKQESNELAPFELQTTEE